MQVFLFYFTCTAGLNQSKAQVRKHVADASRMRGHCLLQVCHCQVASFGLRRAYQQTRNWYWL